MNNLLEERMQICDFELGQLYSGIPCWYLPRTVTSRWSHVKFTVVQLQYFCSPSASLCRIMASQYEPNNLCYLIFSRSHHTCSALGFTYSAVKKYEPPS